MLYLPFHLNSMLNGFIYITEIFQRLFFLKGLNQYGMVKIMKKNIFLVCFFILLFVCILSNTDLSVYYACLGLNLWYTKMIPALFPMMIFSGIMIRMNLCEQFVGFIYPVFRFLFRMSKSACYVLFFGFLCGFPMGAKTINDLSERKCISETEAEFLLMFCNNIGPAYFLGFVVPLLRIRYIAPYLFGMYGIPLLYGLFLRYAVYKGLSEDRYTLKNRMTEKSSLLDAVEESVQASVESILKLGAYMIVCNVLNTLFFLLPKQKGILLCPLLEISGGLSVLKHRMPIYCLVALQFGGLSCMIQTFSCLKSVSIPVKKKYIIHKCILSILSFAYYCFLLFLQLR